MKTLRRLPKSSAPVWVAVRLVMGWGAFETCAPAADAVDATCKAVMKAARDGNVDALDVIARTNDPKMAEAVLQLMDERRVGPEVKAKMSELVNQWPPTPGKTKLAEHLVKNPRCSDDVLLLFSKLGLPETEPVFRSVLAEQRGAAPAAWKNPSRIAIAIRALGRFPNQTDAVVSYLGGCLDEKAPHVVRASAAEALGGIRNRAGIDVLLPHVRDAALGDLALASLYRLTGQDHGDDAAKWKSWLDIQKPQVELRMLSQSDWESYRETKRLLASQTPDDNPNQAMASFYGIEFKARAALFILDCSGSMFGDRIARLRSQMSHLVLAMQSQAKPPRFGIVTFSDGADSCFPGNGIAEPTEPNFKKASRFVERLQADGGTAMMSALDYSAGKILPANLVDAIYFLSDGEPSDASPEMVLGMTREIFEKFRVRFNTVEITEPAPQIPVPPSDAMPKEASLLEKMAKITGGIHVVPQGWIRNGQN